MTPSKIPMLDEALENADWRFEAESRKIGYARVSTHEQNLDMQLDALRKEGVLENDLFHEKTSATSKKRPELHNALQQCRSGDIFVVWRLDRIARSLKQLLTILEELTDRGVGFISLTERVDTTTAIGRLYVQLAGAFAEFERQLIVERTKAGVKRAKERGVKFGAEQKLDEDQAEALLREGKPVKEVAAACQVARQTIYNHFPREERDKLARMGPLKKRKPKAKKAKAKRKK